MLVVLLHDGKTNQNRTVLTASVIAHTHTVPIGSLIAACLQIKQPQQSRSPGTAMKMFQLVKQVPLPTTEGDEGDGYGEQQTSAKSENMEVERACSFRDFLCGYEDNGKHIKGYPRVPRGGT